jgi:hypothetical protein
VAIAIAWNSVTRCIAIFVFVFSLLLNRSTFSGLGSASKEARG